MLNLETIHPAVAEQIRDTMSELKMTDEERAAFLSFRIPSDDPYLKRLRGLDATSYMIRGLAETVRASGRVISERTPGSQAAHLESDLD